MYATIVLELKADVHGVSFAVRVSPRARRTEIIGLHGHALKVSLAAPPVDGEANDALCAFLAKALGVPKRSVRVAQGERSKSKIIRVDGVGEDAIRAIVPANA